MSTRIIHFLVCATEADLIDKIKALCKEHSIIPEFLYRGKVMFKRDTISLWFKNIESVITEIPNDDVAEYAKLEYQSNLNTQSVLLSLLPLVCCVDILTNMPNVIRMITGGHVITDTAMVSVHAFTSALVVYNSDEQSIVAQDNMFRALAIVPTTKVEVVASIEDIFTALNKIAAGLFLSGIIIWEALIRPSHFFIQKNHN